MKELLAIAALGEAAMGVASLIVPSLAGRLLFGEGLTGVVITVRVCSASPDRVSVCCWPGSTVLCGDFSESLARPMIDALGQMAK